jgi:hypothetical protein
VLVTVVPMFAPITIGTAYSTGSTPAPTRPTMVDVDTDDDWTNTVAKTPAARPAIGLATEEKTWSTKSLPKALIPVSSDLTPARKT